MFYDLSEETRSDKLVDFYDSEQLEQEEELQIPKFVAGDVVLVVVGVDAFDDKDEWEEWNEF